MSDRDTTSEDDRILRSARRPIAHLALGPEGDRLLFRRLRERQQQQRRARAAEASRAFASEASASAAMATAAQRSSQKRWIEVIEQYDFEPLYIKGEVADALSRRPDFLGALVIEFGLADDVTQSLMEACREDPFTSEIIRRLEAKDKPTFEEFKLINGLLFLEKAGNKRLCVPNRESPRMDGEVDIDDIVDLSSLNAAPNHARLVASSGRDGAVFLLRLGTFPCPIPCSRRSMLPPSMVGEVDIDNIVDHKETGRGRPPKPKLQYRVQFKHHTDPKEDRWFAKEELMQTAPQAVTQYEKSLQKGKRQIIED
ncbi:hypothetical protein CBR_g36531 [Chara braunii]|uniref:Uncharacterized protein n=1 Tax=Chara braunii TaxID=69332 RepID=A0A388JZ47_CHABU|nr:hypothetical protein CBR_g36531 [Chara braunii]|eukprot:GBG63047.1 hypothetical protein CBR_g36531 [Chara braunii]